MTEKTPHRFDPEISFAQNAASVFRTPHLPCPYLDGKSESRIAIDLAGGRASERYAHLSQAGFRRTGRFAYRPDCPDCTACVSVRVLAESFSPNRSQRRIWKANEELVASECPPTATDEQFSLFRRYQRARHGDGEMAGMDFASYLEIVEEALAETRLIEFRKADGTLVLVGLVDWLSDGPSAVYSFFEPEESRQSLGNFLILWLIDQARRQNLPHVYLGYWISKCSKMAYKTRFQRIEGFGDFGWKPIDIE